MLSVSTDSSVPAQRENVPEYLLPSDVAEQLPPHVLCCICKEPQLAAMRGRCNHRLCSACYGEIAEDNRVCCPLCRQNDVWQADHIFGRNVATLVAKELTQMSLPLLAEAFPDLSESDFDYWINKCLDRERWVLPLRQIFDELEQTVQNMRCAEQLSSAPSSESGAALCCSEADLCQIEHPSSCDGLRAVGRWLRSCEALKPFRNLSVLHIHGAGDSLSFTGLGNLRLLRELTLTRCAVKAVEGTELCRELRTLTFRDCSNLASVTLPPMAGDEDVSGEAEEDSGVVTIDNCPSFAAVHATKPSTLLEEFHAPASAFNALHDLRLCQQLKLLDLHECRNLFDCSALPTFVNIVSLNLSDTRVRRLDALEDFEHLQELRLSGTRIKGDLVALQRAVNLRVFEAARTGITSLGGLESCSALETIDLSYCADLTDISALTWMTSLQSVNLSYTSIDDVSPIASFHSLTTIDLQGCKRLYDLSPWEGFQRAAHLQTLLLGDSNVRSISVWKGCPPNLEKFSLRNCSAIDDISVLEGGRALRTVNLMGTQVADITPLTRSCATALSLLGAESFSDLGVEALRRVVPVKNSEVVFLNDLKRATAFMSLPCMKAFKALSRASVEVQGGPRPLTNVERVGFLSRYLSVIELLGRSLPSICELSVLGCPVQSIAALEHMTTLELLDLAGTQVSDIAPLKNCLWSLKTLSLFGCQVRNVEVLQEFSELELLNLSRTQVADITPLQNSLHYVKNLQLTGSRVDDVSPLVYAASLADVGLGCARLKELKWFGSMTQLSSLSLSGSSITDITELRSAPWLQMLDLSQTQVTDISPLVSCVASLKRLLLTFCPVRNIEVLSGATQLEYVDLAQTLVLDIAPLAGSASTLRHLILDGCTVRSIAPLEHAAQLTHLSLAGTKVMDISPLAGCAPTLQSLNLKGSPVRSIQSLKSATHLEHLDLGETHVTDIEPLASCVGSLKWLSLSTCAVSDVAVLALATQLESLDLGGTRLTDIEPLAYCGYALKELQLCDCPIQSIRALENATQLEQLDLGGTQTTEIDALRNCLPTLRVLRLTGCPVQSLSALTQATKLGAVDISETQVTDIQALSGSVPNLNILRLSRCLVTDISVLQQATQLKVLDVSGVDVADLSRLPKTTLVVRDDALWVMLSVQACCLLLEFVAMLGAE